MTEKYNAYRLYRRFYVIDGASLEGAEIIAKENITDWSYTEEIVSLPNTTYDGKPVLNIRGGEVCGSAAKRFILRLTGENYEKKEVLAFGYNSRSDSNYLKITLRSTSGEEFGSTFTVGGERWSYLLLDVRACGFLNRIAEIEFQMFGENENFLLCGNYQFADVRFGCLLDLQFRFGDAARYFMASKGAVQKGTNCLRFAFEAGGALIFPAIPSPRYSELNMPFAVRDTVELTLSHRSTAKTLTLWYTTDLQPLFSAARSETIRLTEGGSLQSYRVFIGGSPQRKNERLLQLKLTAEDGCGEIVLHRVTFSQEQDSPLNENEKAFLDKIDYSAIEEARRNPYAFSLPDRSLNVRDFGARGDGYTCDNAAVQSAIDAAHESGGGTVVVPDGRYVVTHLVLKDNVHLSMADGALLLQSDRPEDYPYKVQYEHDNIYARVNWAHNFLVGNRPLLYADGSRHIKISGGTIRCMDSGCEQSEVGFPYWPTHCGGVIHIAPIGMNHCERVEISRIRITRASAYHCFLVGCTDVFVDRVRMYDVRCLSADGIGLAGSKNVCVYGCFIRTNDDGITLCSMYDDPRAGNWWKATPGADNGVKNIEADRCYIDSACGGGGKAIAFIPWGTDAPDVSKQEIDGIWIHDCRLKGGHSVGAWPDNPYNGIQPFDNTETDDYSPVKNVRIENNVYDSPVSLECILATDVVSDCGLYSSPVPVNGDFSKGTSNWNCTGSTKAEKSGVLLDRDASIAQGLHVAEGEHTFFFTVRGEGEAFIAGETACACKFNGQKQTLRLTISAKRAQDIHIGVRSESGAEVFLVSEHEQDGSGER